MECQLELGNKHVAEHGVSLRCHGISLTSKVEMVHAPSAVCWGRGQKQQGQELGDNRHRRGKWRKKKMGSIGWSRRQQIAETGWFLFVVL